MLSKNKIKYIKSLHLKKYRLQERKFVVEGDKIVKELAKSSYEIENLFATKNWIDKHKIILNLHQSKVFEAEPKELNAASNLTTSSEVIAVGHMPTLKSLDKDAPLHLYLDSIRDPGNLGTLIRSAAWFGLSQIICSPDCVDYFNSKVLQATMGAFLHIDLLYASTDELKTSLQDHQLVGASLGGTLLKDFQLPSKSILIIGNEGKGISPRLLDACDQEVTISKAEHSPIESLNAAISGSILLSHLCK
jgi:TrmH family RNA methyltransferase